MGLEDRGDELDRYLKKERVFLKEMVLNLTGGRPSVINPFGVSVEIVISHQINRHSGHANSRIGV